MHRQQPVYVHEQYLYRISIPISRNKDISSANYESDLFQHFAEVRDEAVPQILKAAVGMFLAGDVATIGQTKDVSSFQT